MTASLRQSEAASARCIGRLLGASFDPHLLTKQPGLKRYEPHFARLARLSLVKKVTFWASVAFIKAEPVLPISAGPASGSHSQSLLRFAQASYCRFSRTEKTLMHSCSTVSVLTKRLVDEESAPLFSKRPRTKLDKQVRKLSSFRSSTKILELVLCMSVMGSNQQATKP